MGCGGSKTGDDDAKPKKPPTKDNTHKVLCLGIGGCGKTTFVKQMKIIHNVPWNAAEIAGFRKIIRGNVISGLQSAIEVLAQLEKELSEDCVESATAVKAMTIRNVDFSDKTTIDHLKKLTNDPNIVQICKEHPEKMDQTHLLYFLERLDNYTKEDFDVTDEDILRSRQRTAGANSTLVYLNKQYFEFYDIGGQKPERPKWQMVLNDNEFAAILYFVATDEYDVRDEENEFKDSKLELSRLIFSELMNDKNTQSSGIPVVLMLNRVDLLQRRFEDPSALKNFQEILPEFPGKTVDDVLVYLEKIFLSEQKDKDSNSVTVCKTCSLDTEGLRNVWNAIRDSVLMKGLDDLAF